MYIFLIGMMGCGKSAIGKQLSDYFKKPFIDTDVVIETKENKTINEIFNSQGESYFRKIESETLRNINKSSIISCGGGIIIDALNRNFMNEHGHTIYLKTSISVLEERLEGQSKRPLLDHNDNKKSLEKLYKSRKDLYEQTADFTLITNNLSIRKVESKILEHLKNEKNYS